MMTKKQKVRFGVRMAATALITGTVIFLNVFASSFDTALDGYFGRVGNSANSSDQFTTSYTSAEKVLEDYGKVFNYDVAKEGSILLKNDNAALPLAKGSSISIFGMSQMLWMTKDRIKTGKDATFPNAIEDYGFKVNSELRKLYKTSNHTDWGTGDNKGDGSAPGTWKIDEVPQSEYSDKVKTSYASYSDAALVVLSRSCGEGADLPRNMDRFGGDSSRHYLQLTAEEEGIFQAIEQAGCFKKTIVLLHADNCMQMDFLNKYKVDSVFWMGGTGEGDGGIRAVCELLAGDANFSGRTVDTYCYDNLSAPAMQNFGDFRYVSKEGNLLPYSYVNYAEGIYVGYKYYETRYADVLQKRANAGNFDYDKTVAYPFGHGLSYTDFSWDDFSGKYDAENDCFNFELTVKNNGSVSGKEVAEIYLSSPYTNYDEEKEIEKSAVTLVGFAKTKELKKGESEKLKVSVDASLLTCYDEKGVGSYILEQGNYVFTAAANSHEAVNNVIEGNDSFNYTYRVDKTDETKYSLSSTGTKIENQFHSSTIDGATYLSRKNWKVMEEGSLTYATGEKDGVSKTTNAKGTVSTAVVNDEDYAVLQTNGWELSGNPMSKEDYPAIATGEKNGIELSDLAGKEFDDPLWDSLLNQLTVEEMHNIYKNSAYGTAPIESIAKPNAYSYDGPEGIHHTMGGAQMMITTTWNTEIAQKFGEINGDYAILNNYASWYTPAINLHRTPFSGRNYEYISEDSFFTAYMATQICKGERSKGLMPCLKHMALNNQETNRAANGMVATYASEQAIRETYLLPFQMCVEEGGALGTMSSMNRIGNIPARAYYNLNVNVMRKEWGFKGYIITDYSVITQEDSEACLAGGCTLQMSGSANPLKEYTSKGTQYLLRENMHYTLYMLNNSIVMDGMQHGDAVGGGAKVYVLMLVGVDAIIALLLVGGILLQLYNFKRENNTCVTENVKKRSKTLNIVYWSAVGIFVIAVLVIFFAWGLPLLLYAFKIT